MSSAALLLSVSAIALVGETAGPRQAPGDPAAELHRRLDAIESRLQGLEARELAGTAPERAVARSAAIRQLVEDVLADADTRASRLAQELVAG